jgi:hypothetical protein
VHLPFTSTSLIVYYPLFISSSKTSLDPSFISCLSSFVLLYFFHFLSVKFLLCNTNICLELFVLIQSNFISAPDYKPQVYSFLLLSPFSYFLRLVFFSFFSLLFLFLSHLHLSLPFPFSQFFSTFSSSPFPFCVFSSPSPVFPLLSLSPYSSFSFLSFSFSYSPLSPSLRYSCSSFIFGFS